MDASQNVFITGGLSDTLDFQPYTVYDLNGFYLAKYNDDGICQWVRTVPTISMSSRSWGNDLHILPNGEVLALGNLADSSYFDGIFVSTAGQHDVFSARYDEAGNLQSYAIAGGTKSDDMSYQSWMNSNGDVVLAGVTGSDQMNVPGAGIYTSTPSAPLDTTFDFFVWKMCYSDILAIPEREMGKVVAYPNPASNVINLRIRFSTPVKVTVSDVWGRLAYSATMRGPDLRIPALGLPAGLYGISVTDGRTVRSTVVLFERSN